MDQLLFVVRHDRIDLYEALRGALSKEAEVTVVLDHRSSDRRRKDEPHAAERRRWDRRLHPAAHKELAERGWTVVRVSP